MLPPPLEDGASSSVIISTPTRLNAPPPLSSASHNCSWHSVMEEVTEEMRTVKIGRLFSITEKINQKVKDKDLKVTLGKNIQVSFFRSLIDF